MLEKSVSIYSLSKAHFREYLEINQEEASITNVALEHFFGPGDDTSKFVTRIIRALNNKEPIIALTEGSQKRDFVYVNDVLNALMKIINESWKKKPGLNTYQIGTGSAISIRHFVETAKKLSGNSETILNFGAVPLRKNEPKEVIVNLDPIKELGWSPKWTLEQALSETINYERKA
jgi:nucleoside-diphosphate-sugar epimerase